MKIRNGFVSNSSSSSFCLIGREIPLREFKEMKASDLPKEGLFIQTIYSGDGVVCATVKDADFLKYFQTHEKDIRNIFDVFVEASWDSVLLTKKDIEKISKSKSNVYMYSFTIDQGTVDNLSDYLAYYGEQNES